MRALLGIRGEVNTTIVRRYSDNCTPTTAVILEHHYGDYSALRHATHTGEGEPVVAKVGVAVAVWARLDLLHLPLTHPQQRLGQGRQLTRL